MTIDSATYQETFNGNGVTEDFAFNHRVLADADMRVVHINSGGTRSTLVLDTDYSIDDAGSADGININFPISGSAYSTLASGEQLEATRRPEATQNIDFINGGPYNAEEVEDALDRITTVVSFLRGIVVSLFEDFVVADAADKVLKVNSAGTAIEGGPTASEITNAQTYATNAQSSASDASTSETNAAASAAAAAATAATLPQNNATAITAPTSTDDDSEGYGVGSRWVDINNDKVYFCVDATENAAVWIEVGVSVFAAIASQIEAEAGVNNTKGMTPLRVKQAIDALSGKNTVGGNIIANHENLDCHYVTNATIDIDADALELKNSSGVSKRVESINLTADISASGANGLDTGSEAASTWYWFWVILNSTAISTGTTDSTTASKLEDSTADFVTDGVKVGDTVKNTTDGTTTHVTAVDDLNTLSVADDIFVSGEAYEVYATASLLSTSQTSPTMPSGYDYKALVGAVYNQSGSNFDNFHQIGHRVVRNMYTALSSGSATSATSVDLSAVIPPSVSLIAGTMVAQANSSGNPGGGYIYSTSAGNIGQTRTRSRNTSTTGEYTPYNLQIVVSQTVWYKVDSGDDMHLYVSGWEY